MVNNLIIRIAEQKDHEAVMKFTANTFEDGDYIANIWNDWVNAKDGPLLVGEMYGQAIAICKLSRLGDSEGWIQGVRVAPELRGRGIGRSLLAKCVLLSQRRGDRSLRFMTGDSIAPMKRAAESIGFGIELTALWLQTWTQETRTDICMLTKTPAINFNLVSSSALLNETSNLYMVNWQYRVLTPERVREHLNLGQVWALPKNEAWSIVVPDSNDVWLGYAQGDDEGLERLLRLLPCQPSIASRGRLRALFPINSRLAHIAILSNYVYDGQQEHCYVWRGPQLGLPVQPR